MAILTKEFMVWRKSENTNSFGLFQVYLTAKDGETYKACASMYNVKEPGEIVFQTLKTNDDGEIVEKYFLGHELVERLDPDAPKDVVDEIFNKMFA